MIIYMCIYPQLLDVVPTQCHQTFNSDSSGDSKYMLFRGPEKYGKYIILENNIYKNGQYNKHEITIYQVFEVWYTKFHKSLSLSLSLKICLFYFACVCSVGLHTKLELEAMVKRMQSSELRTINLTNNDLVKDHLRHLVSYTDVFTYFWSKLVCLSFLRWLMLPNLTSCIRWDI